MEGAREAGRPVRARPVDGEGGISRRWGSPARLGLTPHLLDEGVDRRL